MQYLVTRSIAAIGGLKFYYTGKPCINGHDCKRYVTTGGCVACVKAASAAIRVQVRRSRTARVGGLFTYDLHPEDHAAALAYCQALDLQRARKPTQAVNYDQARTPATPEQIQALRRSAFGVAAEPEPYIPRL